MTAKVADILDTDTLTIKKTEFKTQDMDVPAFKSAFPSAVNAQTGVSYDDSMAKCEFGLKKHDKLFC